METFASDADARLVDLEFDSQPAQTFERAMAIGRRGIIRNFARAFGQSRQNRIAVRNGFIARQFHNAIDSPAR